MITIIVDIIRKVSGLGQLMTDVTDLTLMMTNFIDYKYKSRKFDLLPRNNFFLFVKECN